MARRAILFRAKLTKAANRKEERQEASQDLRALIEKIGKPPVTAALS